MITVACVRTGTKYGIEYVEKLRNMVGRYLPLEHEMICLTDQPEQVAGVAMIDISHLKLPGWWGKMALLNPDFRGPNPTLYFDLDTVIVGDLSPLAHWCGGRSGHMGICQNFTKLAGHPTWPCNYGSCVMTMRRNQGRLIWPIFRAYQNKFMSEYPKGDQQALEAIYPNAIYLQSVMPPGYFVHYRDFTDERPEGAAIAVFGGRHKPHNTPHQWLREAWG